MKKAIKADSVPQEIGLSAIWTALKSFQIGQVLSLAYKFTKKEIGAWLNLSQILSLIPSLAGFADERIHHIESRKFWAFFFCCLSAYSYLSLEFWAASHWTVLLTQHKVDTAVIIALEASKSALAFGSLAVYGWKKAQA